MPDSLTCSSCGSPLLPSDAYCPACGRSTALIGWSLSLERMPGSISVSVVPGECFFLVARNRGLAPARVEVEACGLHGVELIGSPRRRVAPGQRQAFEFRHQRGQVVRGELILRSETGARRRWWERRGWEEKRLDLSLAVRVREERWVLGTPVVLLPPEGNHQYARVWNDSEHPRPLVISPPPGCRLTVQGEPVEQYPTVVAPCNAANFLLEATTARPEEASNWNLGVDRLQSVVTRLPHRMPDAGPDAVVAIDFGTRNTSVRVRWRRALTPGKPAGTVDVIGDRVGSPRFPTQMVLDVGERQLLWGTEAAEYVEAGRAAAGEVVVDNLKTYLREGEEPFTQFRPEWTTRELLGRYFERLFHRLDEYFRTLSPDLPLSRASLRLRYVVCRPVLDANEGDARGRAYSETLLEALRRCGVSEADVTLVHEPVAAALGIARRRSEKLLCLPEGAAVAVVDSGGGTTDVALARARFGDGRVSLELAGSYGLQLAPDNPAIEAIAALERLGAEDRREVGGNVLDGMLVFQLGTTPERLLESDGPPIPKNLWRGPAQQQEPPLPPGSPAARARLRQILLVARRMKEGFARASTLYLNRMRGEASPSGELLPFPHRDDLRGVHLVHALYDEQILGPVLRPVAGAFCEQAGRASAEPTKGGVRPSEVRCVFYVGGTNVDPFVRQHFARAFPLAAPESEPGPGPDAEMDAQSPERIRERMHAVVEGAVWFGEELFAAAPVTLTLRHGCREEVLVHEGAPLLPARVAPPRFFTEVLSPGAELDAVLIASGGGLPDPEVVARAFHRNSEAVPREVTLIVSVTRERGATAELQTEHGREEQWRVLLEGPPA